MAIGTTDSANSIFEQPWWLDAIAPGKWEEAVVLRGNTTVARMPYVIKKQHGLTYITQPPFTHGLGPWLRPSSAKYANQLGEQKDLLEELIQQIPRVDDLYLHLTPGFTNWLPFYWAGYEQSTRYTYRIPDLSDLDGVWAEFRENIRREVRKAQKSVVIRDDLGIDQFIKINRTVFERQGMELPYKPEDLERLDDACAQRNARKILFAQDAAGRVHAAAYLVWDDEYAYYILGGVDPETRTCGSGSLVIWEAIRFASGVTRGFDFKGSMNESIERFNRSFGAQQVPYFQIMKSSRKAKGVKAAKDILRAVIPLKSLSGQGVIV